MSTIADHSRSTLCQSCGGSGFRVSGERTMQGYTKMFPCLSECSACSGDGAEVSLSRHLANEARPVRAKHQEPKRKGNHKKAFSAEFRPLQHQVQASLLSDAGILSVAEAIRQFRPNWDVWADGRTVWATLPFFGKTAKVWRQWDGILSARALLDLMMHDLSTLQIPK